MHIRLSRCAKFIQAHHEANIYFIVADARKFVGKAILYTDAQKIKLGLVIAILALCLSVTAQTQVKKLLPQHFPKQEP